MRYVSLLIMACLSISLAKCNPPVQKKNPKNIIIMIGDGMGLAQLCAGYALNGQQLNIFEMAQIIGLSNTASADNFITDSAAGATAMSTGFKTNNGMISFLPDSSSPKTIFEFAKSNRMKTGLVVSCALTHATPACFYSHRYNREMHADIASDFYNGTIDIAAGGGFPVFDTAKLQNLGYQVTVGKTPVPTGSKYIAFYDTSFHPAQISEGRGSFLTDNTMLSLNRLTNENGFMLMVEGSQIDWGGHNNDGDYVVKEMLDFDSCVKRVINWAEQDGETLVIITADHETGGLGLMGSDSSSTEPKLMFHNTHHSGIMVPVFAFGPGAEKFQGVYENTDIFFKMKNLLNLK